MYVGGSCVDEVACCDYTRVKCAAITWARCTRVAAVRAPEGSLHMSVINTHTHTHGPTKAVGCVCAVSARLCRRRTARVRVRGERVSSAWPT
jgi:hypothetical protein